MTKVRSQVGKHPTSTDVLTFDVLLICLIIRLLFEVRMERERSMRRILIHGVNGLWLGPREYWNRSQFFNDSSSKILQKFLSPLSSTEPTTSAPVSSILTTKLSGIMHAYPRARSSSSVVYMLDRHRRLQTAFLSSNFSFRATGLGQFYSKQTTKWYMSDQAVNLNRNEVHAPKNC